MNDTFRALVAKLRAMWTGFSLPKKWGVALASVLIALIGVYGASRLFSSAKPHVPGKATNGKDSDGDDQEETDTRIAVKTVLPTADARFIRAVTGTAYVEPYYRVDLYSQVAGPVKSIQKNIGDPVFEGEVLVEVDVPEFAQDVALKAVLVEQAKKERDAAVAREKTMEESIKVAKNQWEEKKVALEQAYAMQSLREDEVKRFEYLASRKAATPDVVEERIKDLKVAVCGRKVAELAILTAESEYREHLAKLEEVKADKYIKEVRIVAAVKAKERAEIELELAKLRAPFNGRIIFRGVDPGAFVQNATTARTQPVLSLIRSDMVTISMMVPERFAPFVRDGADAVIHLESEPGKALQYLRAKVTRFAPYLDPDKGRTVRAEVDIYNPPSRNFKKAVARASAGLLTPLAAQNPLEAVAASGGELGLFAKPGLLKPGMYGTLDLILETFEGKNIVPSSAIFSKGDQTYVFLVKEGVVDEQHVRVLLEDGVRSRIAFVAREADLATGEEEVLKDLEGTEEIVASGQGELREGQEVKTNPTKG